MAYNNDKYNNNLNLYSQEVIDLFYPIGRGFIDFTDTDYSNYLGCTWERELVGMTAVGLDPNQTEFNTIGKTGGSKYLQQHTHAKTIQFYKQVDGASGFLDVLHYSGDAYSEKRTLTSGNVSEVTTGNSGNLQPYKVVAYWKRVS